MKKLTLTMDIDEMTDRNVAAELRTIADQIVGDAGLPEIGHAHGIYRGDGVYIGSVSLSEVTR